MSDLIEHVIEPLKLLEQVDSLLSKNGILLISTPNYAGFTGKVMGRYWVNYKPIEHLFYFNKKSIVYVLEKLDYKIRRISSDRKTLKLNYLITQFKIYKSMIITPVMKVLDKILPDLLLNIKFSVPVGDMLVIAEKSKED